VTEDERIKAVPPLNDMRKQDDTIKEIVMIVLRAHGQPSVGHLAHYEPESFDELFEEAEAIFGNDL
jgi:hypothetical protein